MDTSVAFQTGSLFSFPMNPEDFNTLTTASYIPGTLSLTTTTPEADSGSYVTSDDYSMLSPNGLPLEKPLEKPLDSPVSFRESSASASASPEHNLYYNHFGSISEDMLCAQDASVLSSSSTSSLAPTENVNYTTATASDAVAAATVAAMAAAAQTLPSPLAAESSMPSPTSNKATDNASSSSSTNASTTKTASGKPRRKRQNRYLNASEELMQRRRDQNRHSQRAYRERKDQKIRDLEAKVIEQERRISQLQAQIHGHRCMPALGPTQFQQAPPQMQAPINYPQSQIYQPRYSVHGQAVPSPAAPLNYASTAQMTQPPRGNAGFYTLPNGAPRSF